MTRLLYLIALTQMAGAQGARPAVEACYQRSARAASFKFYPSLVAYRAPAYEAYAPDGARMDLSNEAERYALLFSSALSVRLKTAVQQFEQIDPRHCRCRVLMQMRVERPQAAAQLQTLSVDEWELGRAGWRLRRRRLLEQSYQNAP